MKTVIIVLIFAAVFGGIGFMATAEIARNTQNAQQAADEAKLPPAKSELEKQLRADSGLDAALGNLRKRQT